MFSRFLLILYSARLQLSLSNYHTWKCAWIDPFSMMMHAFNDCTSVTRTFSCRFRWSTRGCRRWWGGSLSFIIRSTCVIPTAIIVWSFPISCTRIGAICRSRSFSWPFLEYIHEKRAEQMVRQWSMNLFVKYQENKSLPIFVPLSILYTKQLRY